MPQIKCQCGNTAEVSSLNPLGHIKDETDFHVFASHSGRCIYVCNSCFKEAQKLAERLTEICKGDDGVPLSFMKRNWHEDKS